MPREIGAFFLTDSNANKRSDTKNTSVKKFAHINNPEIKKEAIIVIY